EGDIFLVKTPGGGGYGNPLERSPELVRCDVMAELLSLEAAREEYGVIMDSTSLEINEEATQRLRSRK
ncbi:MAG: hydantoinase B/oxoprolinase family protein, partial [Candidatus Korarchaeota archaeon]|nr:hydantoinase B/oxoprolinase family protein [Candidatus Korarchaeota archaeon]NIU85315.1 hydantoinase B/oxoprolinase family protein [Candidatus Thorarchaeota archaeon]NIW15414.1 hydantoinase B/oxoprolinase family protein [Candidatus Thorarchaeota archaeon]NIW52214.1 hydantoinase B/oxoprolinase family protein [Candidatus Korarchaeota archaeon]